jgi:hypothetical protein
MIQFQFRVAELVMALPFLAIFFCCVLPLWDSGLFLTGTVILGTLLPMSYLVLLLMVRQRSEQRE